MWLFTVVTPKKNYHRADMKRSTLKFMGLVGKELVLKLGISLKYKDST